MAEPFHCVGVKLTWLTRRSSESGAPSTAAGSRQCRWTQRSQMAMERRVQWQQYEMKCNGNDVCIIKIRVLWRTGGGGAEGDEGWGYTRNEPGIELRLLFPSDLSRHEFIKRHVFRACSILSCSVSMIILPIPSSILCHPKLSFGSFVAYFNKN